MKSKLYATIEDGKIVEWSDSSNAVELQDNQIPLTPLEYKILSAARGDLDLIFATAQSIAKTIGMREVQAIYNKVGKE
jgi:hypothetical protein